MPSLPTPLRSGDPINSLVPWSVRIIDYLRAITVRPSATVSVSTTANGTLLSAAPPAKAVRVASSALPLNQFKVTAVPDPSGTAGEDWLVSVLGGTAQAMFGTVTSVADVDGAAVPIGSGERAFVSLIYRIMANGGYVHEFDDAIDIQVGSTAPQSTASLAYFPVAVVEADGTVLQGHLGAVYLARPWNVVEAPDEETGDGYVQ